MKRSERKILVRMVYLKNR